jgi:hypothetical protein
VYTFPEQRLRGRGMNFKNPDKVHFSQNGMITFKSDDGHQENVHLLISKDAPQLLNFTFWKKQSAVSYSFHSEKEKWGFMSVQTNFL